MRYLSAGGGRSSAVLLHAFPLNSDMWQPQLDRVPDGWRFLAPDLRGFGPAGKSAASAAGSTPSTTVDDYAHDVLGLLDMLEIEKAVLIGLSMGGYVTLAIHRLAPHRCAGLVLADTKAPGDTEEGKAGRRAMAETLRAKGLGAVLDALLPKLVGDTTRHMRPEVVAKVRQLAESNDASAVHEALHALMTRPDSTPGLAAIDVPVLVVVGREDGVTPIPEAELLARSIPDAELAVLDRAGHLSNIEQAHAFSDVVAEFLQRRL